MTIRRFLIIAPAIVTLLLLISYFWVPSYEEQTKGNPDRMVQFITASIGDATMLNPILSAESASSQIESMVFEGLIDRDENLQYRGRVARSWKIYEQAYFYVNDEVNTSRWGRISPEKLVTELRAALNPSSPKWQHVTAVDLLQPETFTRTITLKEGDQSKQVTLQAKAPWQVRITLDQVDQMLFDRLAEILGSAYFEEFDATRFVSAKPDLPPEQIKAEAGKILPAFTHNPVIEFYLRKGVKFHDGRPVTAEDVKFTYEAIVNPKNLSPRVPDYEPVKAVDVIDPLTVRITYKRLYSPAFGTWAMGILPAHLLDEQALAREAAAGGKPAEQFTMRQSGFSRHPVGCGPFVFQEWKSDRYIRLQRFDDYWEGAPNYRSYVMRIIPDFLTQEMEFYAGTIDNYGAQPHQVARLKTDRRFQNFSGLSLGYTYIGYNLRREPFKDRRVRRALGMAIDTQKIIDYVLYGQGEKITGPFVKQTDYYDPDIPLPAEKRQAHGLYPDYQQRQSPAQGHSGHRTGRLEKNRHPGGDRPAGVVGVHPEAGQPTGFRRPDPGLGHEHRPGPLPDLALQPERSLSAQLRGLLQSGSRRSDPENPPGVRPRPPGGLLPPAA
ncbi:MAG: ABC transporter substrate-binding protein [Desulfobacteraceae bacterium]